MNPESVTALVLAAGLSERMGDFKPLMLLGGMTVLERGIRLFQSAGVGRIHVVTGHRTSELIPLVERCGARAVINARYTEGMFSSAAAGAASLPESTAAFFVLPVDVPLVRAATLRDLLHAFPDGSAAIRHPTFAGRRGHPPLIGGRHIGSILTWRKPGGLAALLAGLEAYACNVPVVDEFILADMDRPEDYRRLTARLEDRSVFSPAECDALLIERLRVPSAVAAHGRAVAGLALRIGQALNRRGHCMNLRLIFAAALVHDMCRGQPRHAFRAAEMLRGLDMPLMADIVASHMDLAVTEGSPLRETEVVFLADKLIREERFVGIDGRFLPRLGEYRADPQRQAAIRLKFESARRLAERIEAAIDCPLEQLGLKPCC